ncbi:ABC transporter permease [Herbaspirillum sp. alder98]|uniref:ABC transporter permease n=1 Tax=Herbaspirillum sp. alder98 TaxID=2913096 RepID=UPI001CD83AD7|nr:ABC transporter permease [Herbaspirillum sp. alder98]MCA1325615.1 ABC transporter permease [Herbaspirillum sp. alder98]
MDAMQLTVLLSNTLVIAVPLILAGLGELVTERSGVLNLGVEGMMLIGAVCGYAVTVVSGNQWLGLLAAAAAGAIIAGVYALLVLVLLANQVAAGLALSMLGVGLSAYGGIDYTGATIAHTISPWPIPFLADLPLLGAALFRHTPLVYLSWIAVAAVWWFIYRSRSGLVLRAVGESPDSAHSLGYSVRGVRAAAVVFGGAMAGLAGGYYAVVYLRLWQEQMTAGLGWIALGLVVFAAWRPWRLLAGALLFGCLMALQFQLQSTSLLAIPSSLLACLPYLATVVVLVMISRDPQMLRRNAPASLGKTFFPGT